MKRMIAITNKSKGVVVFYNLDQMNEAISKRKNDIRLRYSRITDVLQVFPSKVEIGKVYVNETLMLD